MLANKNSLKKLEKIFYLKNSIPIGKQPSIKIEGSLHSTSYPNNQNRKNLNLRSEKKLRLQEEFKTKEKLLRDESNKKSKSGDNYNPEVSLGPLDHFFFHLVLDNVKSLFKIERQKKILEKLAIA